MASNTGLPHYRNSKISMGNWEPVYLNAYEVSLTPPSKIEGEFDWEYISETILNVGGLETDQTPEAGVEQRFKGIVRRFASNLPPATQLDLTMEFNVNTNEDNQMVTYNGFRAWCDLVWDPLTGRRSLKKDYIGGPMIVSLHNRDHSEVIRQWTMDTVWPSANLPAMELNYEDGAAIYQTAIQLSADYWNDVPR